ncbi:hypothetical protein OsI_36314 [Oryza sativa Indica Group]|uniref:Uncharacterized protein n=1 Tax=Oryza sativa subsp. indica TaxID=39946 RepID=B8BKU0_ORYSI|nr:hypothetical protein OsI_36314 [Oryza sativa Indica Group]
MGQPGASPTASFPKWANPLLSKNYCRQPSHLSPYRSPLLATPISASAAAVRLLRHRREHHWSAVVLLLVERSFEGSAGVLTGAWGSGLAGAGSGGSSGALEKCGERRTGQAKRRSQRRAGRAERRGQWPTVMPAASLERSSARQRNGLVSRPSGVASNVAGANLRQAAEHP